VEEQDLFIMQEQLQRQELQILVAAVEVRAIVVAEIALLLQEVLV